MRMVADEVGVVCRGKASCKPLARGVQHHVLPLPRRLGIDAK